MGFRAGAYASVWEVKGGKGNYTDVRISTSKKKNDAYETDFSGWVRFIGTAHQKANSLKARDRIKISDCEVTNSYNKEKDVTYTNFAVFTFENANGNPNQNGSTQNNVQNSNEFMNIPTGLEEELPFN